MSRPLAIVFALAAAIGGVVWWRRRGVAGRSPDGVPECGPGFTRVEDHRGGKVTWSCEPTDDRGLPPGVSVVPDGHGQTGGSGVITSPGAGYVLVTDPPPPHYVRADSSATDPRTGGRTIDDATPLAPAVKPPRSSVAPAPIDTLKTATRKRR